MYINSIIIRAIARVKGMHNSISLWIKQMGQKIKKEFENELARIQPNKIAALELDEVFTYIKKDNRAYIFTAVDRNNLRTIAIKVTNNRSLETFLEFSKPLERYEIDFSCSDDCQMYNNFFEILFLTSLPE